VLGGFDTFTAVERGENCTICMCGMEVGECLKTLPCKHVFHAACIDQWLSAASDRCPVDGLSVSSA
jgi:hypothetical protein